MAHVVRLVSQDVNAHEQLISIVTIISSKKCNIFINDCINKWQFLFICGLKQHPNSKNLTTENGKISLYIHSLSIIISLNKNKKELFHFVISLKRLGLLFNKWGTLIFKINFSKLSIFSLKFGVDFDLNNFWKTIYQWPCKTRCMKS